MVRVRARVWATAAGWSPTSEGRRPGGSGLGLDAQRRAIEDFAAARGSEVLARFTEVQSGRKADRPELAGALHLARVTGATPVIANPDRLSRNAAFLLTLQGGGVRLLSVGMPEAKGLTVGIMALLAQAEREASGSATPTGRQRSGGKVVALRATVSSNAARFARDLGPVVEAIRAERSLSSRPVFKLNHAASLAESRGLGTAEGTASLSLLRLVRPG